MLYELNNTLFEVEIMSTVTGEYRTVTVDADSLLTIINDTNTVVTYIMYMNGAHQGEYIITPSHKGDVQTTEYLNKFNSIGNYMDNDLYKAASYLLQNTGNLTVHKLMTKYCESIVDDFAEYGRFMEPTSEDVMSDEEKAAKLKNLVDPIFSNEYNKENEIKYTNIDTFNFTNRTYNCLKRANINYLGQLLELTDGDLIKIRNLGRRSVKEIKDALHERELHLKFEDFDLPQAPEKCKGCEYSKWSWKAQKWVCSLETENVDDDNLCSGYVLHQDYEDYDDLEDYHGIFADEEK